MSNRTKRAADAIKLNSLAKLGTTTPTIVTGPTGPAGPAGPPGATGANPNIKTGKREPTESLGTASSLGDYYIDTDNGDLWILENQVESIPPQTRVLVTPGKQWTLKQNIRVAPVNTLILYMSSTGSDSNAGTQASPIKSFDKASELCNRINPRKVNIKVLDETSVFDSTRINAVPVFHCELHLEFVYEDGDCVVTFTADPGNNIRGLVCYNNVLIDSPSNINVVFPNVSTSGLSQLAIYNTIIDRAFIKFYDSLQKERHIKFKLNDDFCDMQNCTVAAGLSGYVSADINSLLPRAVSKVTKLKQRRDLYVGSSWDNVFNLYQTLQTDRLYRLLIIPTDWADSKVKGYYFTQFYLPQMSLANPAHSGTYITLGFTSQKPGRTITDGSVPAAIFFDAEIRYDANNMFLWMKAASGQPDVEGSFDFVFEAM